ncbi:MAG TPA: acyl-CoA dehydrogenase family protein [Polyangiaceae bacterium]|nr:acyl-CoA dehydrogenase family protein [Polyangiaceae bacterium]
MGKGLHIDWISRAREVGSAFAETAKAADRERRFVAENYSALADAGILGALVPSELGGGGASHGDVCELLRELAHFCPSTALALSMHQHLVAATVWRYLHQMPGEALLRRVAAEHLVLVSTGAGDWLRSNGEVERTEGGYRVSGEKHFASGSPGGDLLVTSAAWNACPDGPAVLHFAVPLNAPGVSIGNDWDTLGMRGTGSHTVTLENVFVPEQAIALKRPREGWHPVWSIVLTVAAPIYSSPYVGIAEHAAEVARGILKGRARGQAASVDGPNAHVPYLLGEMENALATARLAYRALIENTNNYDFTPDIERANRALINKTILAKSAVETVNKAMEAVGGASYFTRVGLEQLLRDVQAAQHHPLPEKRQQQITGRLALGLDPV